MFVDLPTFTLIHVVLSLIGLIAGLVVVGGLMAGRELRGWIGLFLVTTLLTNVTGFGFPFRTLLPSHIVGGISLVILPVAMAALYWKRLAGGWRRTFVITAVAGLYFNAFVLVAQLFMKTPALIVLAPTQKEPAFALTQLLLAGVFLLLGGAALRGFGAAMPAVALGPRPGATAA